MSGCLLVYLSTCLPFRRCTCLPGNMPACLHVFLSTCIPFSVSACVPNCLSTYPPVYILYFSLHVCLNTFSPCHSLSSCITVCLSACLHVYLSNCLPFCNGLSAHSEKTFHRKVSILHFSHKKNVTVVQAYSAIHAVHTFVFSCIFIDKHSTA